MFEKIIGNDKNKEALEKIIVNKEYSNSYMFFGQNGIGKFLFAKEFAMNILQTTTEEANPNLSIIDLQNESIKNDIIKKMNITVFEKPIDSEKKIYIVNNADEMTESAQNSFLKTLEEPPEYVIIILIVKNEAKILNTIKSRCTKILFNKLSNEEIKMYLEKNDVQVSNNLLEISNGSIENILKLKGNELLFTEVENSINNITNINILDFIEIKDKLITKENVLDILEFINIVFYRNSLMGLNIEKSINGIKIVENTKTRLNQNCNFDMTIDRFLFSLWEEMNV